MAIFKAGKWKLYKRIIYFPQNDKAQKKIQFDSERTKKAKKKK